jgi:hypothetical protein
MLAEFRNIDFVFLEIRFARDIAAGIELRCARTVRIPSADES